MDIIHISLFSFHKLLDGAAKFFFNFRFHLSTSISTPLFFKQISVFEIFFSSAFYNAFSNKSRKNDDWLKCVCLFFVRKGRGFSGIFIGNIDLTNSRLYSTINADFKRQISETGRGVSGCRHRCLYQKAEEVSCPLFVPFHMLQYPQIKKFR